MCGSLAAGAGATHSADSLSLARRRGKSGRSCGCETVRERSGAARDERSPEAAEELPGGSSRVRRIRNRIASSTHCRNPRRWFRSSFPTRDRVELLEQCLRVCASETDYPSLEIIIVDNGFDRGEGARISSQLEVSKATAQVLRDDGSVQFQSPDQSRRGRGAGRVSLLLNNDIEANEPGWLREMVSHAIATGSGCGRRAALVSRRDTATRRRDSRVGRRSRSRFPTHSTRSSRAISIGPGSPAELFGGHRCVHAVRRKRFRLNGFNEPISSSVSTTSIFACVCARRGLENVWTPYANLIHHESGSRGHHGAPKEQAQFFREADYMQENMGRRIAARSVLQPEPLTHAARLRTRLSAA